MLRPTCCSARSAISPVDLQSINPSMRVVAADKRNVLGDRHRIDETVILVDERDLTIPTMIDRLAVEPHRTMIGLVNSGQQLDDRGLAGAVLAQQRENLSAAPTRRRRG